MKMCQPHWDAMRQEIHDLGIGDWIAPNGEIAAEQLGDQVRRGENTKINYDPLMSSHNMILNRSLEGLGLIVMTPGFGCTICFLNARRTSEGYCSCGHPECPNSPESGRPPIPDFETWIKGPESAPAAAKAYMVQQGWVTA
jgi:hypothetical protein